MTRSDLDIPPVGKPLAAYNLIRLLRRGIASESRHKIAVCHRKPLILTRFPRPLHNSTTNINTIDALTKRGHGSAKGPVDDLAVFFLPTVPRSAITVTGTRTESSCTKGAIPLQPSPPAVHWLVNGFELCTIRPSATTQPVVFRVCTYTVTGQRRKRDGVNGGTETNDRGTRQE